MDHREDVCFLRNQQTVLQIGYQRYIFNSAQQIVAELLKDSARPCRGEIVGVSGFRAIKSQPQTGLGVPECLVRGAGPVLKE